MPQSLALSSVILNLQVNVANCSSNHLPFALRHCVECYSLASGEGKAGEGERIIILSCPVQTNVICLVERSSAHGLHPSLETESGSPTLLFLGLGGPLLAALLNLSVSASKAGSLFLTALDSNRQV